MRAEMVGYIKRRADTKQYLRLAPVHLSRSNNNHVCHANPMENSTECKSATALVSSQHRVHTAIGAAIPSKPTNARNIVIHVCADESAIEEPRATCMRADVVGYTKRQADTQEYLRPAPVAEQGRCLPLEPLSWAEMIRYIKRLADTKEYWRLAPVTEQSRCMGACADRSIPASPLKQY